jgi:hypothetical protein
MPQPLMPPPIMARSKISFHNLWRCRSDYSREWSRMPSARMPSEGTSFHVSIVRLEVFPITIGHCAREQRFNLFWIEHGRGIRLQSWCKCWNHLGCIRTGMEGFRSHFRPPFLDILNAPAALQILLARRRTGAFWHSGVDTPRSMQHRRMIAYRAANDWCVCGLEARGAPNAFRAYRACRTLPFSFGFPRW